MEQMKHCRPHPRGLRPDSPSEARVREIVRQEVDAALDEMAQQALAVMSREK